MTIGNMLVARLPATVRTVQVERELATNWYNVVRDQPTAPASPGHHGTGPSLRPADLTLTTGIILQKLPQERHIEIPDQVRDICRLSRPTSRDRPR